MTTITRLIMNSLEIFGYRKEIVKQQERIVGQKDTTVKCSHTQMVEELIQIIATSARIAEK